MQTSETQMDDIESPYFVVFEALYKPVFSVYKEDGQHVTETRKILENGPSKIEGREIAILLEISPLLQAAK